MSRQELTLCLPGSESQAWRCVTLGGREQRFCSFTSACVRGLRLRSGSARPSVRPSSQTRADPGEMAMGLYRL